MRIAATLLASLLVALAGCGGGSDSDSPAPVGDSGDPGARVSGDADPGDVRIIDEWARALAAGNVDAAARYFALPSTALNGPTLIRIRSVGDARLFNRSLPCGARLVHADTRGELTTATFRLTERPGPGICGPGTGSRAKTAFAIEGGKIAEWRRVELGGGGGGAGPAPTGEPA